jgi:3',5'-cyclic AMP phosphodiesterase CpdA
MTRRLASNLVAISAAQIIFIVGLTAGQRANEQAEALKGFSDRAKSYLDLQKNAESGLQTASTSSLSLPNKKDSVKFVAMGDNGTGDRGQYEVAAQMVTQHGRFPFDMVIMLGDNMYGSQQPRDFVTKFETPYKPLLDAGVKFYAALGNHDNQTNRFYKPWNMNGERYYSYSKKNAKFFVLDSDYMDPKQLQWIENELKSSRDDWKIAYFHHPLYSSGGRHGSEVDLRVILEPLFTRYGVNVVYSGHDHIYERLKPQKGIYYFVSGSAGQLRSGDLKKSDATAAGYDQDMSFMMNEIDGDDLYFQVITRAGKAVDSGTLRRQPKPANTSELR